MHKMIQLIVILATALLVGLGAKPAAAANGCTPNKSWGAVSIPYAQQIVTLTNQQRAKVNVPPLQVSVALTRAAMYRALHISEFGDYGESDDQAAATACGYPAEAWANDAWDYSTPAAAMHGWISSAGHKRALLDADFRYVGVGVAYNPTTGTWGWYSYFGVAPDGLSGDRYADYRAWPAVHVDANGNWTVTGGGSSSGDGSSSSGASGFAPLVKLLTVKAGHSATINVTSSAMTKDGTSIAVKLIKIVRPRLGRAVKIGTSSIRYSAPKGARSSMVSVRFEFRASSGKSGWGTLKVHIIGA